MNNNQKTAGKIKYFGNIRVMVVCALLIAMSIAFGKLLAFNIGNSIRISFENLPILMAGIFFGPLAGLAVGAGADIIGCLIVGYAINPYITAGAALIGLVAGLFQMMMLNDRKLISICGSVMTAHVIGSMITKSLGLYIYYSTPVPVLLTRIPLYICIGVVETYIIYLLTKNKSFSELIEKVRTNGRF